LTRRRTALSSSLGRSPTAEEVAEACDLSEEQIEQARALGSCGDPRSLDETLDGGETVGTITLAERVGSEDSGFNLLLDRLMLATALDTLPPREKTVLRLRFYRELSQWQIAELIDVSQMHVSRLERNALHKLRVLFQRSSLESTAGSGGYSTGDGSLLAAS